MELHSYLNINSKPTCISQGECKHSSNSKWQHPVPGGCEAMSGRDRSPWSHVSGGKSVQPIHFWGTQPTSLGDGTWIFGAGWEVPMPHFLCQRTPLQIIPTLVGLSFYNVIRFWDSEGETIKVYVKWIWKICALPTVSPQAGGKSVTSINFLI